MQEDIKLENIVWNNQNKRAGSYILSKWITNFLVSS